VKSAGSTVNFFTLAYDCSSPFRSSTIFATRANTLGGRTEPTDRRSAGPAAAANFISSSGFSVISATGYGRRSPYTMTWLMNGSPLRRFSMFWGAMFMPPAVTMRSFFSIRDEEKAVLVEAPDVAGGEPPVGKEHLGGGVRLLEVALGECCCRGPGSRRPGDLHLDGRQWKADRAELETVFPVAGEHRARLGEP
jgi:hypothetical protein